MCGSAPALDLRYIWALRSQEVADGATVGDVRGNGAGDGMDLLLFFGQDISGHIDLTLY